MTTSIAEQEKRSNRPVARLVSVKVKVCRNIRGKPRWEWVDGFQVITPSGLEIHPYMRKGAARAYCKAQGWQTNDGSEGWGQG